MYDRFSDILATILDKLITVIGVGCILILPLFAEKILEVVQCFF